MNREAGIGFRQRIQLDWLDLTAHLSLDGYPKAAIQARLQTYLRNRLSVGSDAKSGNRALAISILVRIWVEPPVQIVPLRDEGLQLLRQVSPSDALILHWGMTMAVYPFFQTVAETVGRLHRLQGTIAASQVQRRMREHYGERSTVERATRRVLRCFIDWGVLQDTGEKGIYKTTSARSIQNNELVGWLVEATLIGRGSATGMLHSLTQHPALFPFEAQQVTARMLEKRHRLEVLRQGIDEEMVLLLHNVVE